MANKMHQPDSFLVRSLFICWVMVIIMIGIGGYTRLSGSGLSMVDWKPIMGWLPPLTTNGWQTYFLKYQSFPEFQNINFDMTLSEFKSIYLVEYTHRMWGRMMALVLCIPTAYAALYNRSGLKLIGLVWVLSASQAVMGWYMVKSGLVHEPHVSPYRLTAHLMLAVAILTVLLVSIKNYTYIKIEKTRVHQIGWWILAFVIFTMIYGGFTAGTKAGLLYNMFPRMGDSLVPIEFLTAPSWWEDILSNPASIQFIHRVLAVTTAALSGLWLLMNMNRIHVWGAFGLVLFQVLLGIATLLSGVQISLGTFHQVWAMLVFSYLVLIMILPLKTNKT